MPGSVTHFSLYAADPDAMMAFYKDVFGWHFEAWGPPGYWLIQTPDGPGATHGALTRRDVDPDEDGVTAFRCSIGVDDVDVTLRRVEEAGGQRASAMVEIPTVGRVVEFRDPAGNLVCLAQYEPGHPLAG